MLLLDRKKAEWKRYVATVRSALSKIFLWFIREVSTTEVQQDFEQVFRSNILQNQAVGGGLAYPFNGDILIAHIESNYVNGTEIRNDGPLAIRDDRSMV